MDGYWRRSRHFGSVGKISGGEGGLRSDLAAIRFCGWIRAQVVIAGGQSVDTIFPGCVGKDRRVDAAKLLAPVTLKISQHLDRDARHRLRLEALDVARNGGTGSQLHQQIAGVLPRTDGDQSAARSGSTDALADVSLTAGENEIPAFIQAVDGEVSLGVGGR